MRIAEVMEQVRQSSGNVLDMLELKQKLDGMGISIENIYQELEMTSAFADSHRDISSHRERVQPHSHGFFELILCCECDNVQYLLDSRRYRLRKGDVLVIPPGVSHCPLFTEEMCCPYERIVVWINAQMLGSLCQRWPELQEGQALCGESRLLRTAGTMWETPIAEAFYRGCAESEKRLPGWEAALYGNTTVLIALVNRALCSEGKEPRSERSEPLDELLHYVEANLRRRISAKTAARYLLVSESTITHLCSKRLGISFYRYVTQRRLVAAKRYMGEGIPLGRVWELAGFGDYSAFYRAFRQEYGFSPREFRDFQDSSSSKLP